MLDPDTKAKIDQAVADAMKELDELRKDEASVDRVLAWFNKWKSTATYKHLGQAIRDYCKDKEIK